MTRIKERTLFRSLFGNHFLTMALGAIVLMMAHTSIARAQWGTSGTDIYNTNSGKIGVGTTSPGLPVDVRGAPLVSGDLRAGIGNYDTTTMAQGVGGGIQFGGKYTTNGDTAGFASISGIKENGTNSDFASALVFTTRSNGGNQTEKLRINSSGNVGIGTANPSERLHVAGGSLSVIRNEMSLWLANNSAGGETDWSQNAYYSGGWKYRLADEASRIQLLDGKTIFSSAAAGSADAALTWTDNLSILQNGNVGIGTTSPGVALTLPYSSSGIGFSYSSTNSLVAHTITKPANGAGPLVFKADYSTWPSTWADYEFQGANGNVIMEMLNNGGVGIGTITPSFRLDVQGGQINSSGGLCIAGDCKTAWSQVGGGGSSQWTTSGTSVYYNGGNIGIGTGSPSQKFQVIGGAGFFNSSSGVSINGGVTSGVADIYSDYLSGSEPRLHLATFSKKSTASGITIDTSGNVGIGIVSPTVALDILGSVNVSGNINAKYQDVAEWVPASHALPAGTVVTLDPRESNHVEASSHAYDTRVAGVVSEQPGITLGESGENKVLVATTGRVRVTVDASRAPIHIGDLLVTSDLPGVAMKSEPITIGDRQIHSPGTLIGKALEPLEKGSGKILVLLSLQ